MPIRLPDLVVTPSRIQIFMFSAVTWNRHLIHYSDAAAKIDGHADVVVQRGLLGNFLARQLTAWIGDAGCLRRLTWRVTSSAYPDQELICESSATSQYEMNSKSFLRIDSLIRTHCDRMIAKGDAVLELY